MDFVCFFCCALAFLLYYNTLEADFVYDDRRAILNNPDVLPVTPLSKLLENDFWGTPLNDSGSHGSFRPLCILTFRLNYMLGGFQPWGYHLVNVLLHVLATGLFVQVSRHILSISSSNRENNVGSAVSGVLFAVHPVHVEAVASLVGRADLMAGNLFFLAIICYVKHVQYRDHHCCCCHLKRNHRKRRNESTKPINSDDTLSAKRQTSKQCVQWKTNCSSTLCLTGCILLSTAALFSKETGITVLAVCIVYDMVRSDKGSSFKNQLRSVALLILAAVTLMWLRVQISSAENKVQFSVADNPTSRTHSVTTRFLTFVYLPVFNFLILLSPNLLSFDWGMDAVPRITTIYDLRNLATATFYGALLFIVTRSVKNLLQTNCAGSLQDGANCYPSSSFELNNNNKQKTTTTVAKLCCHRKKGPSQRTNKTNITLNGRRSSAILVMLSLLVFPFLPATNLFFYIGFVVAERILYIPSTGLCLLVGLGASRLWTGRFKELIFTALVFTVFWLSVRTVLRNRDWLNEETLYRSAVHVNPAKAYGNLGSVLSSQGRFKEAELIFRKALYHRPNMADVHYNLGIIMHKKGDVNESIRCFQTAINFRPTLTLAYLNLGVALAESGRHPEAISVFRQGSRLEGFGLRDKRTHENARISILLQLGRLYSEQGRLQSALGVYRETVSSLPNYYPSHRVYNIMGETLTELNQFSEAEHWFLASLNAEPNHIPAHITYGRLLAKNSSRLTEAEEWFKRAQKLAPQDPTVYYHYSEFLRNQRRFLEAAYFAERAAELKPADVDLAIVAAMTFRQSNKFLDAEHWYRRVVELKPSDMFGHKKLGEILHLNGKFEEAIESYNNALKLQPNDNSTITNLNKLKTFLFTRK